MFDKEALYQDVEQVMENAASVQLQVAKAVVAAKREPVTVTAVPVPSGNGKQAEVEPASSSNGKQAEPIQTMDDLYRKLGAQTGKRRSRKKPEPAKKAKQPCLFELAPA